LGLEWNIVLLYSHINPLHLRNMQAKNICFFVISGRPALTGLPHFFKLNHKAMNTYLKTFLAGVTATLIMTGFMLLAPVIGLPKMNVGELLGSFVSSEAVGWVLHFVIGIAFAFIYVSFFNRWLPVEHKVLRGLIFGIIVFVVSEIILTVMNLRVDLPWDKKEGMAKMLFGNALAGMIYGMVLGAFFKRAGSDGLEPSKQGHTLNEVG
jgi:MFS family permease